MKLQRTHHTHSLSVCYLMVNQYHSLRLAGVDNSKVSPNRIPLFSNSSPDMQRIVVSHKAATVHSCVLNYRQHKCNGYIMISRNPSASVQACICEENKIVAPQEIISHS